MLRTEIERPEDAMLLIVDDEPDIRALLSATLKDAGFRVETAANPREMDGVLARVPVDLIVMDVMMPGEDGLSACRRVSAGLGPVIVMLSALGEEPDRILGLEIGASHYLSKPCSGRELVATVRAALRQRELPGPEQRLSYRFSGWRIDCMSRELTDPSGLLVDLTDGEFEVLRAFVERPRRTLSREALLEAARGRDSNAFDRAIDVQVSRLRRKLRSPADDMIRTMRNEGYFFVPRVSRA